MWLLQSACTSRDEDLPPSHQLILLLGLHLVEVSVPINGLHPGQCLLIVIRRLYLITSGPKVGASLTPLSHNWSCHYQSRPATRQTTEARLHLIGSLAVRRWMTLICTCWRPLTTVQYTGLEMWQLISQWLLLPTTSEAATLWMHHNW